MCGIVGAIAQRSVTHLLLDGLKRLEYRGYDSAGIAVIQLQDQKIRRLRVLGKVARLEEALQKKSLPGHVGIAHTRWATHGQPSTTNAHPHFSGHDIAVVHNGIIENHELLRQQLIERGYGFNSETDTEVIAHLIHYKYKTTDNLLQAIQLAIRELEGAYALGIIAKSNPDSIYAVRCGSPLVIGLGINEYFIASDPFALLPVTQRFIYLEEGDIAKIMSDQLEIRNAAGKVIERKIHLSEMNIDTANKGKFRHFMQKEIFDQPEALAETINAHITKYHLVDQAFGYNANTVLKTIKRIHIVACGTSYHAALVGGYWLEGLAGIPCRIEIASEYRYRNTVVEPNTLFVAISQSGETADTLAALRQAKEKDYAANLGICNVSHSSLVRETDLIFLTRAGSEIGVAATKTFTVQLAALLLLTSILRQHHYLSQDTIKQLVKELKKLPNIIKKILLLDDNIHAIAKRFVEKKHVLFLGRGELYPIAMEGALKLKELSYLHAEAYPAGELKHGPLALVDENMPVIVIAPNNRLIDKLTSNVQEVQARGGELYIFSDNTKRWNDHSNATIIEMPALPEIFFPIAYTIPLQLLAYHIAVLKGTDVDQPRNLAKSVTVE